MYMYIDIQIDTLKKNKRRIKKNKYATKKKKKATF